MRLHVLLPVALLALHARAATIPAKDLQDVSLEPEPSPKEITPVETVSSELDSVNTIKDSDDNLRVKSIDKTDSIPVKVVVEEPKVEDDSTSDLKRVEIDLNNPGEPQHQEHETQNPVHYEDEQQVVTLIKNSVLDTEASLKQGFQGVSQGIQEWIANHEQLSTIQQSIQGLQQSFTNQITRLNETILSFWTNQNVANAAQSDKPQNINTEQLESVENHLKTLEDNFQNGVKALSEGVEVFATLKQNNPTLPPANNLFTQYLQMFQQSIAQGFSNVTQAFQNTFGQTNNGSNTSGFFQGLNTGIQNIFNPGANGAQSDEPITQRPSIWSSIQNFLNPGQSQTNNSSAPTLSLGQGIQNLPFVQGVVNLIQPSRPAANPQPIKPSDITPNSPEGTNAVPPKEAKPETETKPEAAAPAKATEEQTEVNKDGPIKNIIQNNPIVKGISDAVQKLQSLSNPEKPRDTVNEQVKEVAGDAKGHSSATGDHNDSSNSSGLDKKTELKSVNIEEPIPEEPVKEIVEQKKVQLEKTEEP